MRTAHKPSTTQQLNTDYVTSKKRWLFDLWFIIVSKTFPNMKQEAYMKKKTGVNQSFFPFRALPLNSRTKTSSLRTGRFSGWSEWYSGQFGIRNRGCKGVFPLPPRESSIPCGCKPTSSIELPSARLRIWTPLLVQDSAIWNEIWHINIKEASTWYNTL